MTMETDIFTTLRESLSIRNAIYLVIRGPDALARIQMPRWDCGRWTADPLWFPTDLEPWE